MAKEVDTTDTARLRELIADSHRTPMKFEEAIHAVWNAAPAMLAELDALRLENEKCGDDNDNRIDMLRKALGTHAFHGDIEGIERLIADRDALRERVAELEALARYVDEQLAWIEETGDSYTKEGIVDFVRRTRSYEPADAVLAARDARMRREGAAEWLEKRARHYVDGAVIKISVDSLKSEAARLREGGE